MLSHNDPHLLTWSHSSVGLQRKRSRDAPQESEPTKTKAGSALRYPLQREV